MLSLLVSSGSSQAHRVSLFAEMLECPLPNCSQNIPSIVNAKIWYTVGGLDAEKRRDVKSCCSTCRPHCVTAPCTLMQIQLFISLFIKYIRNHCIHIRYFFISEQDIGESFQAAKNTEEHLQVGFPYLFGTHLEIKKVKVPKLWILHFPQCIFCLEAWNKVCG